MQFNVDYMNRIHKRLLLLKEMTGLENKEEISSCFYHFVPKGSCLLVSIFKLVTVMTESVGSRSAVTAHVGIAVVALVALSVRSRSAAVIRN